MEGHIYIEGEIGQDFSKEVRAQLNSPDLKNATELIVHIQSPGGSVYAGYNTYHVLKSAGKPITTIIEGEAQSMATFIALAGDKIIIRDPSIYMIHNPSQGLQGDADMLQGGADELRKIEVEMVNAYALKTKLPPEEIRAMMKKETRMDAHEAKKRGFVDEILNPLRAVALGSKTKPNMEEQSILDKIKDLIGINQRAGANQTLIAQPKNLDLPLTDGTVLVSDAESEDMINGSNVTIAGAPAPNKDYQLNTGMVITVVDGKVTAVVDPTDQKMKALLQALQAEKAAATKAASDAEAAKAEAEKIAATALEATKQTAIALGKIQEDIETNKKKTVGDDSKPFEGVVPLRQPIGASGANDARRTNIEASRRFIIENLPWLEQYYPKGHFDGLRSGPSALSIVETNFSFTYPGLLTTELFYKPTLSSPALSDIFTIDQGISFKKQYNVIPGLSKVIKPYTGCGGSNTNSSRDLISNVELVTKEFRMQEKWCKDDFTGQLSGIYNNLAQEWLKTGEKSFDPAGTPIDTIIQTVLQDAMRRDLFIRATMAAGNSSSADYNQIDGLWDRLIDSSGGSNYCVRKAPGTALGTGTLAAGAALAALQATYDASNDLLKEQMDKAVFWVTGSVYDNYVKSLQGTGNVSQAQYEALINGIKGSATWNGGITFNGIPVMPVRLWDSSLADSSNPLNATTRHLILLTVKQNHMLGVESGADLNRIETWYENKDSARYYRSDFKIGYQYLHCDLQTIYI